MHRLLIFFVVVVTINIVACNSYSLPDPVAAAYAELPDNIDFNIHVKPIISDKCFMCHGPDTGKVKAQLQLISAETAFAELASSPGKFAIKRGNVAKSELYHRIISTDPEYLMPEPSSHLSLSDLEKATLIKWIEQGAEYTEHWAFLKPEKPTIPQIAKEDLVNNPIDNFILSRLESQQLTHSGKAEKEILLRRASFDITGLPPSPEDLDEYLEDSSPDAFEKQIDKLFASPHYGEQRTLEWMDLARYADTHGYSVDRYRDISPWRDWVIKSFNENLPYEDFVTWQLAGDLMENPTQEMKLATAFNRLHPQNMEGGIVNDEFLVEYAVDRVSTTGQAFMGLTVACARCHDHKYDPISQKNFYELTSFFDNINESGQISWNNATPVPTMLMKTKDQTKMLSYIEELIGEKENEINAVKNSVLSSDFVAWVDREGYRTVGASKPKDLAAYYPLDNAEVRNSLNPAQRGHMERQGVKSSEINMGPGKRNKGIIFDGDTWLELPETGVYGRNNQFSISLWANIPTTIKNGNILHKGDGAILYNWRGYHLKISDDKLELMMAHTAPGNAIIKVSKDNFPRDQWVHFGITYDGSSKASGLNLYVNGEKVETIVQVDHLYKDILFGGANEPGLQFGARWRGKGIKGGIVDEIRVFNRDLSALEILQLAENDQLSLLLSKKADELNSLDKLLLEEFYLSVLSKKPRAKSLELEKLRKTYVDSVEKVAEMMVMEETPQPKPSYFLERGVYDAKKFEVFPNTPEEIFPMPADFPKNRLGLAKWIFHEDNPLAARVAVNRIWQTYFGVGLVKTSEDFGNQGELPSHPELLDWLAIYFQESGWDMKALQKMIVMSQSYQQSSKITEELLNVDPENRLLARGPSKRLSGEMLRDNALAASGLLNRQIGGKSVYPYQPEGLWIVNGGNYTEETDENLYRRSMYTIWKRSVPHPSIATFDTPTRSNCTSRRQETNTPLQALALLNDPIYIETARAMGEKMGTFSDSKTAITAIFRELTGRSILPQELELLSQFQLEEYENFNKNKQKTKGWLTTGIFRISNSSDAALIASNAVVASTIMNSDPTIMKR